MKKILYCCPYRLDPTLGGAKVYIENAAALKQLGWDVTLISPDDLGHGVISNLPEMSKLSKFSVALDDYLRKNASKYDVVEYEHTYLPYPRTNYNSNTVMVARSILLAHQFTTFEVPTFNTLRSLVGKILKAKERKAELDLRVHVGNLTFANADLVNVPNPDDKNLLVEKFNIPASKIHVLPYGLSKERHKELAGRKPSYDGVDEIAFVGTFDLRKGAKEFPKLIETISAKSKNVRFKLLGTSAMFPTKEAILNYIPGKLHRYLEILPKFSPESLPVLLQKSKVGVFPSHMESFGFGVLEMIAAGIPVVAYDVPGPNLILPQELLVKRGDHHAMAEKVLSLLNSKSEYDRLRDIVIGRSLKFDWGEIGKETEGIYLQKIAELKSKN